MPGQYCIVAAQAQRLAHQDDANDVVWLSLINRQSPVVGGCKLGAQGGRWGIDVNGFDLAARRHNVVDADLFEVEQV